MRWHEPPSVALAAAAVLIGAAVAGCGAGSGTDGTSPGAGSAVVVESRSDDGGRYAGLEVDPPFTLPPVALTSEDGTRVRLAGDPDRPVRLFFFGYTLCPDICSLVMADLALAVARLPAEAAEQVRVVFVTSDPARDTPAALRAYLDRFDPDFTGLTGDLDTIVRLAGDMGVAIEDGPRLPSGGYEVRHGAQVTGYVGSEGRVVWPQGTSVDDLATDLARLVAEAGAGTRQ